MYVHNGNFKSEQKEKNKWMLNDQRSLIKEKKKKYMSIVFGKNIINVLFIYTFLIPKKGINSTRNKILINKKQTYFWNVLIIEDIERDEWKKRKRKDRIKIIIHSI